MIRYGARTGVSRLIAFYDRILKIMPLLRTEEFLVEKFIPHEIFSLNLLMLYNSILSETHEKKSL